MINSIELLNEKRIPADGELYLPDDAVFYVVSGSLAIGDHRLSAGQYLALGKNTAVTFKIAENTAVTLLNFSFNNLGETCVELGKALYASCVIDMNNLLGGRELWLPHNRQSAEKMSGYVVSLLIENDNKDTCGNKYVDMAKRYIDINYFLDVKVEELAGKIGVDRKYLRNLFVECLGVSTKDYIMNLRMERAKELLARGDVPVNSVAFSVGYSDALGFSKMFKKYTGLSPSEYRNGSDEKKEALEQEIPARNKKEDIKYFLL